jgi:hypothetical protein
MRTVKLENTAVPSIKLILLVFQVIMKKPGIKTGKPGCKVLVHFKTNPPSIRPDLFDFMATG